MVHLCYMWVKKTPFLWTGPEKLVEKYLHVRTIEPREKSAMDVNGLLQECTGAPNALHSLQEKEREGHLT